MLTLLFARLTVFFFSFQSCGQANIDLLGLAWPVIKNSLYLGGLVLKIIWQQCFPHIGSTLMPSKIFQNVFYVLHCTVEC